MNLSTRGTLSAFIVYAMIWKLLLLKISVILAFKLTLPTNFRRCPFNRGIKMSTKEPTPMLYETASSTSIIKTKSLKNTRVSSITNASNINMKFKQLILSAKKPLNAIQWLKSLLETYDAQLQYVNAVCLLQVSSRAKLPIESVVKLPRLLQILNNQRPTDGCKSYEIANLIYGLRSIFMLSNGENLTKDQRDFVMTVTDMLRSCRATSFNGQEVGNIFYGLQSVTARDPAVKDLLRAIVEKLKDSSPNLSQQEIAMCLYGFRRLGCDQTEASSALDLVCGLIEKSTGTELNERSLGLAINGLQAMDTTNRTVRRLLLVLSNFIKKTAYPVITADTLSSVMFGLRNMTTPCLELDSVVDAIAAALERSGLALNENTIGSVIGSMRFMSDTRPSVRRLLAVITKLVDNGQLLGKLQPESLSHCLSGFRSMTCRSHELKDLLAALVRSSNSTEKFKINSRDIGRALYGLQSFNWNNQNEAVQILYMFKNWIDSCPSIVLSNRDVGLALYGFKSQSHKDRLTIVPELLLSLASKIRMPLGAPLGHLNAQSASMAMLGLQGFKNGGAVDEVLDALIPRLSELDSQACGNCLLSLRYMNSESAAVLRLLSRLADMIVNVKECLSPQEIGNALWGLQGMSSSHSEVRKVVAAIAYHLHRVPANEQFSGQEISIALSGLQSMSDADGDGEVATICGLLADRLEACPDEMKPGEIANALFGLQGMTAEHEGVRAVLVAMLPKMKESKGVFSARDIGFSIVGLSGMEPMKLVYSEVWLLLEEINVKVAGSELRGQPQLMFELFGRGIKIQK